MVDGNGRRIYHPLASTVGMALWWNGRHPGLKIRRPQGHASSTLAGATNEGFMEIISFEKLQEAREWLKDLEKVSPGVYTLQDALEQVTFRPESFQPTPYDPIEDGFHEEPCHLSVAGSL